MTISGKKINYTHFLFDGCHKFYLTNESKVTDEMLECGYTQDDLFPIDELPYMFYNSCSLRFISTFEDLKRIVPQCRSQVTFRGFGKYGYSAKMDFIKDKVYTDEAYFRTNYSSRVVYQKV
jgi:hypothetical protein